MKTLATLLLVLFSLTSCNLPGNDAQKVQIDPIPDGFRQVKLLQKLPESVLIGSTKQLIGETSEYRLSGPANALGNVLDTAIRTVGFYTESELVKKIYVVLDGPRTELLPDRMMQKFGVPESQCSQKITFTDGATGANDILRWTSGANSLELLQDVSRAEFVIIIQTKEFMGRDDANKINPAIRESVLDCKKYIPPVKADKDGF